MQENTDETKLANFATANVIRRKIIDLLERVLKFNLISQLGQDYTFDLKNCSIKPFTTSKVDLKHNVY